MKVGTFANATATPAERIAQGVGMLSEDRKTEGLALELSIADNVTLSRLGSGVPVAVTSRQARCRACSRNSG